MEILFLIIFGALAGWLASLIMKTDFEQGTLLDIALGILGSIVGGVIVGFFGMPGVSGFNLYSLVVAVLGAVVVISVGRFIRSR